MNDLNSPTSNWSPLNGDVDGRFSRRGIPASEVVSWSEKYHFLMIAAYIAFLLATDFILFSGSGNVAIFQNSVFPIPEVAMILGGVAGISFIFCFLLKKYPSILNLSAAIVSFGVIFIFFHQFSTFNRMVEIGSFSVALFWVVGIGCAFLCYIFYAQDYAIIRLLFTIASAILFAHVYFAYMKHDHRAEFLETHNNMQVTSQPDKRFIYFMFPNLSSSTYISSLLTKEADKTFDVMIGFYQKNNFTFYPKAFVPENNYKTNMVYNLNFSSSSDSKEHLLNTKKLMSLWQFYNMKKEFFFLKDNELYDLFIRNKYQLSAYKSHDFDLCHKNHNLNVSRCVEKVNHPTNIYDSNLSTQSKLNLLLIEWLSSMQLFNNMSPVYNLLIPFVEANNLPMVGINYNNLYVVNSTKTFDILLDNIKNDSGRQAYFVFVDLPSDMYIYDEYCQIKPTEEWIDIANLPWVKVNNDTRRNVGYLQQTRCLYGKMQEFMDKLSELGKLKNTIIIMQGTSGVNGFKNRRSTDFMEDFVTNRLVSMATYDNSQSWSYDERFCSSPKILSSFLIKQDKCPKYVDLGVHSKVYDRLQNLLNEQIVKLKQDYKPAYSKWYSEWKKVNDNISENKTKLIEIQDSQENFVENNEEVDSSELEYFGL